MALMTPTPPTRIDAKLLAWLREEERAERKSIPYTWHRQPALRLPGRLEMPLEHEDALAGALERLSPASRAALLLRVLGGFSVSEVAQCLGYDQAALLGPASTSDNHLTMALTA